ncbi:hypothetical protein AK812_SmicGene16176 [Symbiodinium microadriaticum]|uniref:Uncharacterized protein n=1 Tax=Symbiodinium microadriaticum TaxID=2951 RepID=A0A1Q9E0Z6_SYMMI|nr:hypothetical protein AK812_SmicGene16176 [Symbiodinium microadriaticum]
MAGRWPFGLRVPRDSKHFQKNPWLRQVYWTEVCAWEKRPHLFHYTRVAPPTVERSIFGFGSLPTPRAVGK